jgi:hypothetical protein
MPMSATPEDGIPVSSRAPRLLDGRDVLLIAVLMSIGLGFRLLYYSGFGLDDDPIFRGNIDFALHGGSSYDNVSYRLAWLLPTLLSCRIFGLTELGLILPIIVTATLAIGLVYAIGKALWDTPGAVLCTLLLIVFPLDMAWSTMLANDVMVSFYCGLTMLCLLLALRQPPGRQRAWRWALVAFMLWLATQAKLSAVIIVPGMAAICAMHYRRLDRSIVVFLLTATLLFGLTAAAYYRVAGDVLAPYHAEVSFQALVGPAAATRRLSLAVLLEYPRLIFLGDRWGDRPFSFLSHAVVVLLVAGVALGLRPRREPLWWLLAVFLGMEFTIHRAEGMWVAGFRNIRHTHLLVYPLVLTLTGSLLALRERWPRLALVLVAGLLAIGIRDSVAVASKTHEAFGDMRAICRFFATQPPGHVVSDAQLPPTWCPFMTPEGGWNFELLSVGALELRRQALAAVDSDYLVTGGGREPYYGCHHCILLATDLPPGKWRLLHEFPGPKEPAVWRPEPLRVWTPSAAH